MSAKLHNDESSDEHSEQLEGTPVGAWLATIVTIAVVAVWFRFHFRRQLRLLRPPGLAAFIALTSIIFWPITLLVWVTRIAATFGQLRSAGAGPVAALSTALQSDPRASGPAVRTSNPRAARRNLEEATAARAAIVGELLEVDEEPLESGPAVWTRLSERYGASVGEGVLLITGRQMIFYNEEPRDISKPTTGSAPVLPGPPSKLMLPTAELAEFGAVIHNGRALRTWPLAEVDQVELDQHPDPYSGLPMGMLTAKIGEEVEEFGGGERFLRSCARALENPEQWAQRHGRRISARHDQTVVQATDTKTPDRQQAGEQLLCSAVGHDIDGEGNGLPALIAVSGTALHVRPVRPGYSRPQTRFLFTLIVDYEVKWDDRADAWLVRILTCSESDVQQESLSAALQRPENGFALLLIGLPGTPDGDRVRNALIEHVERDGAFDPKNRSFHPLRSGDSAGNVDP